MMHHLYTHRHAIILVVILALALGLRLWGVRFGLPYVGFQPDEWYIADEGLILVRDGFTFSRLIGSLHGYIQAGVGWPVFRLAGVDPAQVHTYREMLAMEGIAGGVIGIPYPAPAYYLWGRIAVAVMSTISIGLTYLIGREVESAEVGLLGALFLAASPLQAEDSHYIVRSGPGLMFLLLAFYVILAAYRRGRWRLYGLGSVLAALAILIKQNNVIIVVPLGLALGLDLWRVARRSSLKGVLLLGILAGVFLTWGQQRAGQRLRHWPVLWHGLMVMGALAITLTSLKLIVVQDYWFSQKDVRVTASEWLQANISTGAKVVVEQYGPYLSSRITGSNMWHPQPKRIYKPTGRRASTTWWSMKWNIG